jgi:hypothetical protein
MYCDHRLRFAKMTTINLALRNLYGYVLWGNSLVNEVKQGYRTGMNMFGGFVRHMRPGELSEALVNGDEPETERPKATVSGPPGPQRRQAQAARPVLAFNVGLAPSHCQLICRPGNAAIPLALRPHSLAD